MLIITSHDFFLRLLLLIKCTLSLPQAFLNNTELKIFGRYRESNSGPLACIARERERIHLILIMFMQQYEPSFPDVIIISSK